MPTDRIAPSTRLEAEARKLRVDALLDRYSCWSVPPPPREPPPRAPGRTKLER